MLNRTTVRLMSTTARTPFKRAVFVDGVRTPFMTSFTTYNDLMAADLGKMALKGLLTKTAIDPATLDYLIMGTVIQEVKTSNLARESALLAGIPDTVPAHTVTMACISANQAAASGGALINSGQADAVVVGGAETMSDVPIRFSREIRKKLLASRKGIKGPADVMKLLRGLKLAHLAPEAPAIAEFSTGEVMGQSSDRLASKWGVTRKEQDEFAYRSHINAAKAHDEGIFAQEIFPYQGQTRDNGVRGDTTIEKLSTLKPAFVKPHGTHTAANSSYLTDGASAALLMSEERALKDGLRPKAKLIDWIFTSQDPKEELLLGPAYSITRLLHRNGLKASDIDAWELHEAFAGQVLSNLKALDSDSFVRDSVKLGPGAQKVGQIPMDKINPYGGSLSIGHPFGATGTRLLTTAANRLIRSGGRYAVLAACAAGGQGHAMLIERWQPPAASVAPVVSAATQPAVKQASATADASKQDIPKARL